MDVILFKSTSEDAYSREADPYISVSESFLNHSF